MNILVLGIDGYIGWSLAMQLSRKGHRISGIDNLSRRSNVESVHSSSAFPILRMQERIDEFRRIHKRDINFYYGDVLDYNFLTATIKEVQPDCIVHLAEQPSAPFSMIDREHALYTQHNNVEGTLNVLYAMKEYAPNSHLVKLGTMGEYGTPNIDIAEGFFEVNYKGRSDTLPFPKQPGSMYHLSKVHDTDNTMFACRIWGLRATDIMQGVVYGTSTFEMVEPSLYTRFDFDECFGTVINRYCAQAIIGHPLTPYGKGKQKRGFINLLDSLQCLTIAAENPAAKGEYRVFNQIDEVYGITELAEYVAEAAKKFNLSTEIRRVPNPRKENEEPYYNVEHDKLRKLGFKPTLGIKEGLHMMLQDLYPYRDRILEKKEVIVPKTLWVDRKDVLIPEQKTQTGSTSHS